MLPSLRAAARLSRSGVSCIGSVGRRSFVSGRIACGIQSYTPSMYCNLNITIKFPPQHKFFLIQ